MKLEKPRTWKKITEFIIEKLNEQARNSISVAPICLSQVIQSRGPLQAALATKVKNTKRAQVKSEANLIKDVEVSCEVHRSPRGLPRSRHEVTKVHVDVDVEAASTREAFKYGSRSLNPQLSERQRSPARSKCNAG